MTELEQQIYAKGLETVYASVLLAETEAISHIENMVMITRYLKNWGKEAQHLDKELDFVRSVLAVCFPEQKLRVIFEPKVQCRSLVCPGSVAGEICTALFQLNEEHVRPDVLLVGSAERGVSFKFSLGGETVWEQTVLL